MPAAATHKNVLLSLMSCSINHACMVFGGASLIPEVTQNTWNCTIFAPWKNGRDLFFSRRGTRGVKQLRTRGLEVDRWCKPQTTQR